MSDTPPRDATVIPKEPGFAAIGTTIAGRYKVEALLGTGGMGAVYLVQHTLMHKRFALKMLNAETSRLPEMVARFEREAIAAGRIDHPNIAGATDFGRAEDGTFFLVLEYLEGQRLRDALAGGPIPFRRAVHIAMQVASALVRTHELGIIHRDLKPENIMLVSRQGDRDFVKVLDFGLAKVAPETLTLDGKGAEPALTKHGTVFGTPKYMAPEQCVCQAVDARTDLYALGWVLFEMLTGVHPYAAKDVLTIVRHQLSTPTPAMQSVAPAVRIPAALEAVVQRLTDKRPEHRYASATAAHAALAEVLAQEDAAPPSRAAAPAAGPSPHAHTDAAKTVASLELVSAIDIPAPSAAPPGAVVAPAAKSDAMQAAAAPAAAGLGAASQPGGTAAPNSGAAAPASAGAAAAGASASAASTGAAGAMPAGTAASAAPNAAVAVPGAPPGEVARRDAVPAFLARLPPPLQQRPALLLVPVALLGLGLVWLLHTPSAPGPKAASGRATTARAAAQAAPAPKAQLEQAIAAGAPELLNLAKAFPGDARVKRALAHTYMAQHNGMEALRWLAKVTALDASLVQDGEILQAAKLAFNRAEQADDTIAVLETELGERGVDALYLLAVRPGPIRLKLKFNQSLAKPEVRKRASRAALVALDLRAAATCEQKRALLPRAKQYGDRRALQLLSWWMQKQNCGPFGLADCAACLRQDGALQSAIAAITGRVGTDN